MEERQTDRQTEVETDRGRDRQTGTEKGRETKRWKKDQEYAGRNRKNMVELNGKRKH